MSKMQTLNTLTLPLNGKVLIEASAGTGKTYSLAALYVRLVIGGPNTAFDNGLLPEQILVLTFTRAATQELRHRIRQRLAEAAAVFQGNKQPDANDTFLTGLLGNLSVAKETATERCLLASRQMDKAAIYTIHGFCQRVLQRFAFAASQPFEQEMSLDETTLIRRAYQDYWRRFIQPFPTALAIALEQAGAISPDKLRVQVTQYVKETSFEIEPQAGELPAAVFDSEQAFEAYNHAKNKAQKACRAKQRQLTDWLHSEAKDKRLLAGKYGFSKKGDDNLAPLIAFIDEGKDSSRLTDYSLAGLTPYSKQPVPTPPDNLIPCLTAMDEFIAAKANANFPINSLLEHAANWTAHEFERQLTSQSLITFNSMVTAVSRALDSKHSPLANTLASQLRHAYPCTLIDEFQDTNSEQYGIFDAIYQGETPDKFAWLMIGDPKQSIYKFQGADIDTYIEAKQTTLPENRFTLDTNYRSSQAMIEATNALFSTSPMGNDKLFGNELIQFQTINYPDSSASSDVTLEGKNVEAGIHFCYPESTEVYGAGNAKPLLAKHFAKQVQCLLSHATLKGQAVKPKDITLLVRSRHQASDIKAELTALGIESVFLSERNSVYDTQDAFDLFAVLQAIAQSGDSGLVRSALATRLLAYAWQEQHNLFSNEADQQTVLRLFRDFKVLWEKRGPLPMLHRLVHQLDLPKRLSQNEGERSLTNLFHLAELLQQNAKKLDGITAQLQAFEQALIDKPEGSEDSNELLIRLENERNRVQIMTLHKSKGLEFPFVLLPFATLATDSAKLAEEADEAMRLLYVGITRAKHACFIGLLRTTYKSDKNSMPKTSPLGRLLFDSDATDADTEAAINARLEQLTQDSKGRITVVRGEIDSTNFTQTTEALPPLASEQQLNLPTRLPKPWRVTSYSGLLKQKGSLLFTAEEERHDDQATELPTAIKPPKLLSDELSYHTFPKGRHTGNLLHDLLEQCSLPNFRATLSNDSRISQLVERAARAKEWQDKQPFIEQWLKQVLTTPLTFGDAQFTLAQASTTLAESEFWLKTSHVDVERLNQLTLAYLPSSGSRRSISQQDLNGMVKGFIDLLVAHDSKYYVLDYKSNWLGANSESYHHDALQHAVISNRYDLQGLIYQQALHRLLQARLPHYDPTQHLGGSAFYFLRGLDNPNTHGLFFIPPNTDLLDKMEQLLNAEEARV